MRRPDPSRAAGGPDPDRDAGKIERHELHLARRCRCGEAGDGGQPGCGGAQDERIGTPRHHPTLELFPQSGDRVPVGREPERGREADDTGQVGRARPPPALLAAAFEQRARLDVRAKYQGAYTRRPAELVRRHAQGVRTQIRQHRRQLAEGLDRVAVQECPARMGEARRLTDRLNDAGLVVGEHQRHHARPVPREQIFQRREIDHAIRADRGVEGRGIGLEHARMLDGRDKARTRQAEQRQIVRFGPTRSKDDPVRRDTETGSERPARALQQLPGVSARPVRRGWIAGAAHDLAHRRHHLGPRWRSGRVVEIDRRDQDRPETTRTGSRSVEGSPPPTRSSSSRTRSARRSRLRVTGSTDMVPGVVP